MRMAKNCSGITGYGVMTRGVAQFCVFCVRLSILDQLDSNPVIYVFVLLLMVKGIKLTLP